MGFTRLPCFEPLITAFEAKSPNYSPRTFTIGSDGDRSIIVEAPNRSATIATESAEEIASTAQHFGQDDDITVLTVHINAS
jgi:hypothetical protein